MPVVGNEVCASGSLVLGDVMDVNRIRRALTDDAGRAMMRGQVDEACALLNLATRAGTLEMSMRCTSSPLISDITEYLRSVR